MTASGEAWARRREREDVRAAPHLPDEWLRDDPGTPLGLSGRTLREDGQSHLEAWAAVVRRDPCAFCGGEAGTLDHIDPKRKPVRREQGGAHSWLNYTGMCASCNGSKRDRRLLLWMLARRGTRVLAAR